jgi:hypothetical protein
MTEEKTTIKVTKETWKLLNDRKTEPGQTYDDVVQELLDEDTTEATVDALEQGSIEMDVSDNSD